MNLNQRIFLLPLLLITLTSVVAFWQIQIPENTNLSDENKDQWQTLNIATTDNVDTALATLKKFKLWGNPEVAAGNANKTAKNANQATATGSSGNKPTSSWRLVGIIQQGQQRYVLLLDNDTKKVSTYGLKNTLPDEANLVAIHDDFIEIKQADKIETRRLYQ
jgi:hypothetical protein